jgi:lipoprotein-anchoring transpeptidase ErfK/SrfK
VTNWTAGMQVTYFAEVDGTQYKGSKRWYKVLTNPDRFVPTWSVFSTPTPGLQEPSPLPKSGPLAWTGRLQSGANVRIGPGTTHQVVKSWGAGRRVLVSATVTGEAYEGSTKWYQVAAPPEQSLFLHSSFVTKEADIVRVDKPAYAGRWIDVDLTNQVMTAYYGAQPLLVAQTASGTDKNPTDKGTYPTFWRLASQRMQGDNLFAADYYNLDAVPYISYFHPSGEAIHGAYWHDNFGTQLSHGCVNTSLPTAQWVLTWAPLGTQVVVH